MRSLDLFSGIGGISLGLRGFFTTAAYCEIDTHCANVLRSRMKDGSLQDAPIISDIKDISHSSVHGVDAILAGFPCQGFSASGVRKGLADARSKLFYEILRAIDVFKPKLIFLENVPLVVRSFQEISSSLHGDRGYELRWVCLPASDVGAPHLRNRWFCLAVLPSFRHAWSGLEYTPFDWSEEPQRMIPQMTSIDKSRMEMLGNSVVPDVVRKAFIMLVSAFKQHDICTSCIDFTPVNRTVGTGRICGSNTKWPSCGIISESELHMEIVQVQRPNICLILEGGYPEPDVKNPKVKHELMQKFTMKPEYPTPRRSCVYPSRVLTKRSMGDLGTMLAFEINTPPEQRHWWVNPRFVEWLMGYPEDYTAGF
jgi:hypothetical protein